MTFQSQISIGKIILIPETEELDSLRYCVSVDPNETVWQDGVIYLSPLFQGKAHRAWHLQHKRYYVNCLGYVLKFTKKDFKRFSIIDEIPDGKIEALQEAWYYAEIKRRSG